MSRKDDKNIKVQQSWNTNAEFWNQRMADGNDFFNILLWPAVENLLRPAAGERLLDVACGNGLTSRRLAQTKARVTAFDFSEEMIRLAKQPVPHLYFHRPLGALLAPAFKAGLVLDAIEERAFPAERIGGSTPFSWDGRFSEIPAALVGHLKRTGG